ncbi:M48 family metallopeptidase [Allorhodopirellula heiligendammensis]|uniref:TPR repeat-containing protein YfgC n=1 Tax=Allorhodopirellula heiligendammensis TaxID=2714739 RepID=A0A5C6BGJ2_9BACT|nr:M48 family metallopeptidase [Allorhodopirellula heiligendammensis]TWU10832.1 TPR repeat-containing protein YfgC precursor [Allorhodopirellula heiligendammensis]
MQTIYSGGVFSDSLPDGRAGGEVELAPAGVSVRCPDGESFVIPYRDCQVEMGGYHGRMIFCRNPDRSLTIYSDDSKFRRDLSLAAAGTLDNQLAISHRQRRSESRRSLFYASAFLLALAVLVVGGYFGIRRAAKAAVLALPTSVDEQIGNAAMKSMTLEGPPVKDRVVVDAMQTIVDRLAPAAAIPGLKFNVQVVESPTVNAFALPGGHIVIYTGLIESAKTPEQVAAVLAHEMSHVTLRHGLQRVGQSLGVWAGLTLLIGDVSGLMGAGVDLFHTASINHYSREHENEADREGVQMLQAARIDPAGMPQFFSIMAKDHAELPGIFTWVSTHPDEASRIADVKAQIANLPPQEYRPLDIDWAEVQTHLHNLPANQPQGE